MNHSKTPIADLIESHFNVLKTIIITKVDHDLTVMEEMVAGIEVYSADDRYLIIDPDTHYYLPGLEYSLTWFNIIKSFIRLGIPLWTIIVISNGANLEQQFKHIVPSNMQSTMPTVIDLNTAISALNERIYFDAMKTGSSEFSTDQITHHGISMMGVARVHRNMLYNQLKNRELLDRIAVSYKNAA